MNLKKILYCGLVGALMAAPFLQADAGDDWAIGTPDSDGVFPLRVNSSSEVISSVGHTITSGGQVITAGDVDVTAGDVSLNADNKAVEFGAGTDAEIQYDGVDLEIDPRVVGSGRVRVEGALVTQLHEFAEQPTMIQPDGSIPAGVDTETNIHAYKDGLTLLVENINTQTILAPAINATGMNYGYDQTNTDGIQWVTKANGSKGILNKDYFTIGTSPAFYASLKLSIGTVAGTDDCVFGFRKDAAFQALADNYTDMAAINVIAGTMWLNTIDDNAATTSTNTTDTVANATSVTLKILVSDAGVVTYTIDGAAPTTTAAFTIDDADDVVPFFYMINNATLAGAVVLQEFEAGLQ